MAFEIERKFLVKAGFLPQGEPQIRMEQGYLCAQPERTVRVRIAGEQAFITVKGKLSGISRPEFEYPVPMADALDMMKLTLVEPVCKVRHILFVAGKKWEVDVFEGANAGLILAEVELSDPDEVVELPGWVATEVSQDMRYHNSQLAQHPYSCW
ncbi:MAG: CYTH domain-containing protein [Mangrovibacterium sp.]